MEFIHKILFFLGIVTIFRSLKILYRYIIGIFAKPYNCKDRFQTNYALVTGASSGLGRLISLQLARQGLNIIGVSNCQEDLDRVHQEIEQIGVQFIPILVDFFKEHSTDEVIKVCQNYDIGVAFLNAGIPYFGPFVSISQEFIPGYMNLMVTSYAILSKYFLTHMKSRNEYSAIYITSSLCAQVSGVLSQIYHGVKAWNSSFAKCLDVECRGTKVTVTVVHPGGFLGSHFF